VLSVKQSMPNFLMISKFLLNKIHYIRQYPSFLSKEIFFYSLALLKKDNIPNRKFILYCSPRTGSNLLSNLLRSHPEIDFGTTILSPRDAKILFFPILYIVGHCKACEKLNYGFKIHPFSLLTYQKLDVQKFLLQLHQAGWKIIHLKRLNLVRQQISLMVATQRNKWTDIVENSLINSMFYIDENELIEKIQKQEIHLFNENKALEQIPHITITYEKELLKSEQHQKTVDRIFEYLDIESVPVKTKFKRTTTDKLSDFIENYEEIVSAIRKTKYAKFLDDK